jgi:type VI protein secretion system component Hcp
MEKTMMRKETKLILGCMVVLAGVTSVQAAPAVDITVTVNGLSCSTTAGPASFPALSWNFGVTNSPGSASSGAGAGKVQYSNFVVTKTYDACSAALFAAVQTGLNSTTVTLTQSQGKMTILTIQLKNVAVSGYQLSGKSSAVEPSEEITLAFGSVDITPGS